MNYLDIEEKIEVTQEKLTEIQKNFAKGSLTRKQGKEAIEGFTFTLEELNVSIEELHAQHSELLTTRNALERERQKYHNLFEFAPEAYIVTNLKGIILEVNEATKSLLKAELNGLINKPLVLYVDSSSRCVFHAQLDRVIASEEKIENCELKMQSRQKKSFAALLSVTMEQDYQGKKNKLLWSIRDISDRILAEEKINQQAALLEVTTDAIITADKEDKITYWNSRAEKLYGWRREEAIGKDLKTLWWEEETIPEVATGQKIVTERETWQQELKKLTKIGQELLIQSRWFLIRDRQNLPKGILIVDTDITEKKNLESQLFRSQRLESLGTLASGIAHDLNNILNPILVAAQILSRIDASQEEKTRLIEMMEKNARQGANIVQQILSFSGDHLSERQNIHLRELIAEIKQLISIGFPKQIKFYTSVASDLRQINVNTSQIHQVLMNLCINARDAMGDTGTLLVCAENCYVDENYASRYLDARVGNYVLITIADTGCGMLPEVMERIYEPFFTTKKMDRGTGLGLFTVINIVKNHNGFINVSSQVGKGTQFQIFLPTVEPTQDPPEKLLDRERLQSGGEVILIVDDEEDNRQMLQMLLESSGYQVLTACNGQEAIATQQEHREEIALILMDLMMPVMNGATAIAEIVKNDPQAKIIVISGLIDQKELEDLPNLQGHLTKPLNVETVLEAISQALEVASS
jgi:two-component system, cell cycle sensor histidine kinase and response regulator CckA